MNDLKRFYNHHTNSVLRFKPLFQSLNHNIKKKEIIGICWDTDVLDVVNEYCLRKGTMIVVIESSNRIQKTYKGELLFEFLGVSIDWSGFVNNTYITHRDKWNCEGIWEDYSE